MGSKAWRSVPRSVLLYGRDPDDPDGPTRVVAVSKANYAAKRSSRVKIESVEVPGVAHPQPRAVLMGRTQFTDANLLANAGSGQSEPIGGRGGQKAKAEALIYRLLEDGGGEIEAKVAFPLA
jgi:hypothetical protein